jgi:hypothetical protein
MFIWKNTDPRCYIDKCANIVILRPIDKAGFGFVDTDEGWYISTSFEDHELISVSDDWDESWFWIFAPY